MFAVVQNVVMVKVSVDQGIGALRNTLVEATHAFTRAYLIEPGRNVLVY